MNWLGRWLGRQPAKRPVSARSVGVYATVHTTVGDYDTEGPSHIELDCELITLVLPIRQLFQGFMHSSTLHFGITNVETKFDPPIEANGSDNISVVHTISMIDLLPGGSLPEWARRAS